MQSLSFQDTSFLRFESPARPFHVGGLFIMSQPEGAPANFLRSFAAGIGRLNELWPEFNRQLRTPDSLRNAAWVEAMDYDPAHHVQHYALPAGAGMPALLQLVARAHERVLNRHRPLWETHLIEGLPRGRFAVYCKVHHAVVDGVGSLRMMQTMWSPDPAARFDWRRARSPAVHEQGDRSLLAGLGDVASELLKQTRALPELSALLAGMGMDAMRGRDAPRLPFTAPHTILNTEVDATRRFIVCDLSMKRIRDIARHFGGTINDVVVAVCGGAMREYLLTHDGLPEPSLVAGLPVSVKSSEEQAGNQLSFINCPFFTDVRSPARRLRRIIKVTRRAKNDISQLSATAALDLANLMLLPGMVLTLTHNATRVPPFFNAIVSNVPGPSQPMYFEGARLERFYPLSIVSDGVGINITVISYAGKMSFAVTSCPTQQPGIAHFDHLLRESYRELLDCL